MLLPVESDADVLIGGDRIERIGSGIAAPPDAQVLDARGCYLIPGMIDDQVHFREPGLTNKGDLATESAAAAAGDLCPLALPRCLLASSCRY